MSIFCQSICNIQVSLVRACCDSVSLGERIHAPHFTTTARVANLPDIQQQSPALLFSSLLFFKPQPPLPSPSPPSRSPSPPPASSLVARSLSCAPSPRPAARSPAGGTPAPPAPAPAPRPGCRALGSPPGRSGIAGGDGGGG